MRDRGGVRGERMRKINVTSEKWKKEEEQVEEEGENQRKKRSVWEEI